MKVISRAEAKARRLKRYFTGKPCKRGHVAERLVSNRQCLTCSKVKVKLWHMKNPERSARKSRERAAKERAAHPEKPLERQQRFHARNPDYAREQSARKRMENPEKEREYQKAYRKANHDRLQKYACEKAREWRRRNPEKTRDKSRRYRANHIEIVRERVRQWRKENLSHPDLRYLYYKIRRGYRRLKDLDNGS